MSGKIGNSEENLTKQGSSFVVFFWICLLNQRNVRARKLVEKYSLSSVDGVGSIGTLCMFKSRQLPR